MFNDDGLFVKKSVDFVELTSKELFLKTGVSLYVFMSIDIDSNDYINFKNKIIKQFQKPFVAIVLIKNIKTIDIIESNKDLLDTNKVYWEYMVPLIPTKNSELTSQALSAIVLNGYIEIVDLIADKFGVIIEHNVAKNEKGAKMLAKAILYFMLFSMLTLFIIFYFFKKRVVK